MNTLSDKHYFKGLNGLRAIAAISVLIFHINHSLQLFGYKKGQDLNLAGFGVTIFFSLSGFLITYLLINEKEKYTTISLKRFYLRRIFRIWPLYFTVLILSTIIAYTVINTDTSRLLLLFFYVFFMANIPFIIDYGIPNLGHLWSIGVEEQFYIFWPILVLKSKNLLKHIMLFIVAMNVLRFFFRFLEIKYDYHLPYLAIQVTRYDCLAIGGVGAILYKSKSELFLRLSFHPIAQIVCWGSLILMAFNKFHILSIIDNSLVSIITIFLIINLSENKKAFIKLDNMFFNFLGDISYGIYVWHLLLIFLLSKMNSALHLSFYMVYVVVILSTVSVATLSYFLLEKPFLRIKKKYE